MTLSEFNTQSLNRRAETIWEWGYFISTHKRGGINTVLYSLNGFFAELLIRISDNKVLEIKSLTRTQIAEQYMDCIERKKSFLLASVTRNQQGDRNRNA
jgi:hypothetical protein